MFDKDKKYLSAAYISEGYDRKVQKKLVADACGSVRHAAESAGLIMSNAAMKAAQMVIPEQKIPEFDIGKDISALSALGISVSALTQPTHIPFVDDKKFLEQFTKAVIPNSVLGTSVFDLTQTVRIPRDVTMGNIQSSLSKLNNIGENVTAISIDPFKNASLSALEMSVSDLTRSFCIPKEDTIGNIAVKAMQSSLMSELNIREQVNTSVFTAMSIDPLIKNASLSALGISVSDVTQSFRIPDAITYLDYDAKGFVFQEYIYEHDKGHKKNDEVKLILLGNGRVGKTSIAKRLCGQEFKSDEPITHGINRFSSKKKYKDKDINFKIWDFGGQDIYHATHQLFLTKDTIYLVIHDNQADNNDCPLDYWLENIRNLGGNSPIIIVHNKKDESEKRNASMLAKYCEEYGLDIDKNTCAVNARDKEGFPHLRKLIQTQLEALPHVFEKEIPNSWVAVREILEEECRQDKKTLSYDEYIDICYREGLTEENAQVLCQFLHQISVILYFGNFNSLGNSLLIIDPIWASKLIYGVLNPKTSFLEQRMGKFNKKDLFEHFHASKKKTLSENEVNNLLKLMLNFELCFKVFGESDEYIAPQFLPEEKEKRSLNLWHYKGSAHLRYRYRKFIPKSTMIRMLSRFGNKIEEMYYWKNGLVWNGQDADALIEAFPQNKYIDVSVQGSNKRLLTDIYQAFHEINGNCPVEIEIPCPCSKCETSSQPHAFGITLMQERHQKSQDIQCQASGEQVKTNDLIGWLNFKETQTVNNQKPLKLFYSYSHQDEELRNELAKHLKLLERQGLLEGWHDRKIGAGEEWKNDLDENLVTADIILLLISKDFIDSNYCYETEGKQAMKQHEEGKSVVIPIMLRPYALKGAPFMELQGLPINLMPVTKWKDRDEAFTDIAIGLRATVEEIWKKRNNH